MRGPRWIHDVLPERKQVLALSATFSPALLSQLEELMHEPRRVLLCPETVSLVGVRQFYSLAPGEPRLHTSAGTPSSWPAVMRVGHPV